MLGIITITATQAEGLREAIRPFNMPSGCPVDAAVLVLLHEKILLALVEFDTKAPETIAFPLTREECMFISQFLSRQDGNWAQDVLKQSRRALYELRTGVLPAWAGEVGKLFDGVEVRDEKVAQEPTSEPEGVSDVRTEKLPGKKKRATGDAG